MGVVTRIKSTGDLLTDGIGYDFPEEIRGGRNLLLKTNQQFDWVSTSFGQSLMKTTTGMTAFPGYSSLRGKTLTLSLDVNTTNLVYGTTNPWLGAEIRFDHPNMEPTFVSLGNKTIASGTSGNWVKYSRTVTLPDKEIISSNTLTVLMRDATGSVSIKNIKLEVGSVGTSWTPAPEDLGLSYPSAVQEFRKTELYEFPEQIRGGRNLFVKSTSQDGFITATGTILPPDVQNKVSDYINIQNDKTYTFSLKTELTDIVPWSRCAWYDINKNFISVFAYSLSNYDYSVTITPPVNAVYARVSARYLLNDESKLKFELGNKSTAWSKSPEDLGITYPNWLQNFTESFSDKAIVCGEFIEDSTKTNPVSLKHGSIAIKGVYQEGVTL